MNVIVVTGGIASGKSTVVRMLLKKDEGGIRYFDCDREVDNLLDSGRIAADLVAAFGEACVNANKTANRDYIRNLIFSDPSGKKKLEEIIHPLIRRMCHTRVEDAVESGNISTFVIDVPLYFESGEFFPADKVCVVATSKETQMARIAARNGFTRFMAESMIDAQMPTQDKIDRADVVFWNDGTTNLLQEQVDLFWKSLPQPEVEQPEQAEPIDLNELRGMPFPELYHRAESLRIKAPSALNRAQLVCELAQRYLHRGVPVFVTGVAELTKEGYFMLRDPKRSFRPSPDDVCIAGDLPGRYKLRPGNLVKAILRGSRPNDRYLAVGDVLEIEGKSAKEYKPGIDFEKLTPLFPKERLFLENKELDEASMRVLDLITPLGKGQRGLIVAPPRGGKTVLLKTIAKSLRANYPKVHLLILLLDERPEEVSDFEENVDAPVYASTFDEPSRRHAQVSDLVLERAKRLVEQGEDVIILLDSLTRLARGYNANQSGGRIMSGGLGSNALEKPRKFFGAARNVDEGGSLTIIATCLVDTESRMDEVIFEEFKGTGNMEIRLDRELSERRIYPAISIQLSGTRNDDRLYHVDEMPLVLAVRRQLAQLPGWEGLELLLKNIAKTQNNTELLLRGLR